ncbi:MAG TPA: hypothetical protein VFB07_05480 [Vicinamibacterales bacterium]|nr:hypothetical protein [Vicinamibacterales bacterium]
MTVGISQVAELRAARASRRLHRSPGGSLINGRAIDSRIVPRHGGQATPVTQASRAVGATDKARLLAFLGSR